MRCPPGYHHNDITGLIIGKPNIGPIRIRSVWATDRIAQGSKVQAYKIPCALSLKKARESIGSHLLVAFWFVKSVYLPSL